MNTDNLLKISKEHRNSVLGLLFLLLVIVLAIFFFLSEGWLETWKELMGYIGSALVSILLAYFLFIFLVSKGDAGLFELQPREITKEFDEILSTAQSWKYKGNFGRYLRGKVLPTLSVRAQRLNVIALVIDPSIKDLCERHASYRGRINSIDKGASHTPETVALQVLVTIVICAWYKTVKAMDIRVFLTKTYDPVRIDSNGSSMIVTVEDRRNPALKVKSGHFMFEHFDMQISSAQDQGREVEIRGMSICELSAISEKDVESVLSSAKLIDLLSYIPVAEVVKACKESKNPYEN